MKVKELREQADNLFGKRTSLLMLWQELSENFYPERADFTTRRSLGTDFAANLMSSYPVLCRRNLGEQVGQMLRPKEKAWAYVVPADERREDNDAKRWLEWAGGVMRRAMYDRKSRFEVAESQADHDYVTFGQAIPSVRLNKTGDRLLYRTWHLRDVAWMEGEEGQICMVARKWKPTARDLQRLFGSKIHQNVEQRLLQNKPFDEFNCYHIIVEAEMFTGDFDAVRPNGPKYQRERYPYVSIYYDCDNEHALEVVPTFNFEYSIERWQQVSGSQYAFSPAAIIALPDARTVQSICYTLLEAGEKIVNPPLLAQSDVLRSDAAVYAGGMTWLDRDYDERLGAGLRPMPIDAKGMPIGMEMLTDGQRMLAEAFYLNKLKPFLPTQDKEMTAYQAGQIVAQYIREALPLFAPMEPERNGQICELTWDILMRNGAFGSPLDMPKSLRGVEVQFRFLSPLHEAIEQAKGQKFLEMKALIAEAVALDENVAAMPDAVTAVRDALSGIGVPGRWVRSETSAAEVLEAKQAAKEAEQVLAAAQASSEVAANLGAAQRDMAAAAAT